jgi:tetratricopeptide (TPR) repeat protein
MFWVGVIHEVLASKGPVKKERLDNDTIRLEHWQNQETDRTGYLRGLAWDCYMNPENDRNAHYFARELYYKGLHQSAIEQFKRHIAMDKWPTEKSESWNYIGDCEMALGDSDAALAAWTKAFEIEPNRREPLMKIADFYYKKRSPHHVIAYTAAALQVKGGDFYANYQPFYEDYPHEILYWALWQVGDTKQAKAHFDICRAYKPFREKYMHDMRFFYSLPKVSIVRDPEAASAVLESVRASNWPTEKFEMVNSIKETTGDILLFAPKDLKSFAPDAMIRAYLTADSNKKSAILFEAAGDAELSSRGQMFFVTRKLFEKIAPNGEMPQEGFFNRLMQNGYAMKCGTAKYY